MNKPLPSQVKSSIQHGTTLLKNHCHSFESEIDINNLRTNMLTWYDINKRDLQWRDLAKHSDPNIRAYSGSCSWLLAF